MGVLDFKLFDNFDSSLIVILLEMLFNLEQFSRVVFHATLLLEHTCRIMITEIIEGLLDDEHNFAVLLGVLHDGLHYNSLAMYLTVRAVSIRFTFLFATLYFAVDYNCFLYIARLFIAYLIKSFALYNTIILHIQPIRLAFIFQSSKIYLFYSSILSIDKYSFNPKLTNLKHHNFGAIPSHNVGNATPNTSFISFTG